jgi:hypothetical protein
LYEQKDGRWIMSSDSSDTEPVQLVVRGPLRISKDQRECRTYDEGGYAGLGECSSALILGPGFWMVFDGSDSGYDIAIGIIIDHLRLAN